MFGSPERISEPIERMSFRFISEVQNLNVCAKLSSSFNVYLVFEFQNAHVAGKRSFNTRLFSLLSVLLKSVAQ